VPKPTASHTNVRSVPLPWSDWLATCTRRHASAITPSSECPGPDSNIAVDCLGRFVSRVTCYMSSGTLHLTNKLTNPQSYVVAWFLMFVCKTGPTDEECWTCQAGRSHKTCLCEARSYVDCAVPRRRIFVQPEGVEPGVCTWSSVMHDSTSDCMII